MNIYPFDAILLNGREVEIQQILSRTAIPKSEFEAATFSFIADWFGPTENFIQHTSGSTGPPKTITITQKQIITSAKLTEQALGLTKGYNALCCLSPAYIAGKMMLARCFITGMKVISVTPSANPFMEITPDQRIDFVALVPSQLHDILRSEKSEYFHTIKKAIIGGAILDSESQHKLQQYECKFYATYGMTETVSHIALRLLNGKDASADYTTLPGITIGIDNRSCLVIRWPNLSHPIITNDVVDLVDENTFRWIGRWDNVINTGGTKVIPEAVERKIEKIFQALGISQNFFVGSLPDQKYGHKIVLVIEGDVNRENIQLLNSSMHSVLSKHEIPKEILTGISFIITENGKINRKATLDLTSGTTD